MKDARSFAFKIHGDADDTGNSSSFLRGQIIIFWSAPRFSNSEPIALRFEPFRSAFPAVDCAKYFPIFIAVRRPNCQSPTWCAISYSARHHSNTNENPIISHFEFNLQFLIFSMEEKLRFSSLLVLLANPPPTSDIVGICDLCTMCQEWQECQRRCSEMIKDRDCGRFNRRNIVGKH